MKIKKVSIIGLGALGILFGSHLSKRLPEKDLRIIADVERIRRYQKEQVFSNGERCEFHYVTPEEAVDPADLLIIAVKFNSLDAAIQAVKNHVGPHTIILSLLNGISSESIIGQTYGMDKLLDCVAQGMDAVKVGNRLTYSQAGMICFGERKVSEVTQKMETLARFFEEMEIPFLADIHMDKRIWGKFMLNVGVNQTVAVYKSNYGAVQNEGPVRDMMIAAMREVIALSEKEGVNITQEDLQYWLKILIPLNPEGKPSMRQDMEAGRYSEVGLFAGTVLQLGEKHGISTPVNRELYDRIVEAESTLTS